MYTILQSNQMANRFFLFSYLWEEEKNYNCFMMLLSLNMCQEKHKEKWATLNALLHQYLNFNIEMGYEAA